MIQINLLPDVKTKYIAAQRKKRLIIVSSVVVSGVALGILVMQLGVVYGAQKVQLNYYDNAVKKNVAKLNSVQDLDKILTVQNQLKGLSGLHEAKPAVNRIFTFLPQITPNDVQMSDISVNIAEPNMTITGTAKSFPDVNKFVDTLKFTKLSLDGGQTQTPAFNTVVLTSYGTSDKGANYTVVLKYDKSLFESDKNPQLIVPKITSTRSETERPNALFNEEPKKEQ